MRVKTNAKIFKFKLACFSTKHIAYIVHVGVVGIRVVFGVVRVNVIDVRVDVIFGRVGVCGLRVGVGHVGVEEGHAGVNVGRVGVTVVLVGVGFFPCQCQLRKCWFLTLSLSSVVGKKTVGRIRVDVDINPYQAYIFVTNSCCSFMSYPHMTAWPGSDIFTMKVLAILALFCAIVACQAYPKKGYGGDYDDGDKRDYDDGHGSGYKGGYVGGYKGDTDDGYASAYPGGYGHKYGYGNDDYDDGKYNEYKTGYGGGNRGGIGGYGGGHGGIGGEYGGYHAK
ncbi:hypothetical protein MAR_015288 [Mya arenaria]|uniref:Uncharacterized protein n=2 Tax=Mya arenaria TaxID=6604 RepID=A0ABY7FJ12_MYAAR|nr:hypothetical protein MAR_015288 [Mya arenaria]